MLGLHLIIITNHSSTQVHLQHNSPNVRGLPDLRPTSDHSAEVPRPPPAGHLRDMRVSYRSSSPAACLPLSPCKYERISWRTLWFAQYALYSVFYQSKNSKTDILTNNSIKTKPLCSKPPKNTPTIQLLPCPCSSSECEVLHGECIQTYVPYLFLVIPLGPVTLTGQVGIWQPGFPYLGKVQEPAAVIDDAHRQSL